MSNLLVSVLIPVYNGADTIGETIESILNQSYEELELIVQDNDSIDNTREIVNNFSDQRIKYYKNDQNLGYARNLREGKKNCKGDILFLMGADDVLLDGALEKTVKVFDSDNNVGGVVRSYYWFSYDKNCPIRITKQNNEEHDVKINIADNFEKLKYVFDNEILGQLSGLAFRMKYIDHDFSLEPWISHGYPMVSILKKHSVVFLEGNYLAVRVGMNATRIKSPLYDKSPMLRWIELYEEVFKENKFKKIKQKVIKDVVAVNYVGLIQIKNFGKFSSLLRECWYLIKYRSLNIFSIKYWFFAIGTIVIPSSLLLPMVDFYKDKIISRSIGKCR